MIRLGVCMKVAALLVVILTPSGPARAHGEADWIKTHPDYGWCCGPEDCSKVKAEDVRIDDEHYVVERHGIRWPVIGAFKSVDHHYWMCIFMRGTELEQIKCFFAPTSPAM